MSIDVIYDARGGMAGSAAAHLGRGPRHGVLGQPGGSPDPRRADRVGVHRACPNHAQNSGIVEVSAIQLNQSPSFRGNCEGPFRINAQYLAGQLGTKDGSSVPPLAYLAAEKATDGLGSSDAERRATHVAHTAAEIILFCASHRGVS